PLTPYCCFPWADRRYTEVEACETALTRRSQEADYPPLTVERLQIQIDGLSPVEATRGTCPIWWPLALQAAAAALALLSGRFQLAVAFCVDVPLPPRQHILRRDIAGGALQADVIVVGPRSLGPNAVHPRATVALRAECTRLEDVSSVRLARNS